MGQVRGHALHVSDIVKRQFGDEFVHLEEESQGLANAASCTQQRHFPCLASKSTPRPCQGRRRGGPARALETTCCACVPWGQRQS